MNNSILPLITLSLLALSLSTGCPVENNANNSTDATPDAIDDIDEMADEMVDEVVDETVTPTSGWAKTSIGCVSGNPFIALHFDAQTGYMGCGESSTNRGLFVTKDGGRSWSDTARKFSEAQVVDIRRAPNGKLYGAGKDNLDGSRVFEIDDTDVDNLKLIGVFFPMTTSAFKKVERAQNIAVTGQGHMLADDSVKRTAGYKPAGSDEWQELEYVGEGEQVLTLTRVRALNEAFYGVGSTIDGDAEIHLPSKTEETPIFTTISPVKNRDIELQDFHIWNETKMIAVGVNNTQRFPVILIGEGDLYEEANWKQIDLFDSGIEFEGNIRGMAVNGDNIVVVGGKVPSSAGGFVLMSSDAGETWTDITPVPESGKVTRLWNVWLWENGDIYAAGESAGWAFKK